MRKEGKGGNKGRIEREGKKIKRREKIVGKKKRERDK